VTPEKASELILTELRRAVEKHPNWPENRLRQVAIMVEEAGEALQAALTIIEFEEKITREKKTAYEVTLDYNRLEKLEEDLKAEVVSTAAMALRWLTNWQPLYASSAEARPNAPAS
jgi:hypothetical protein